MKQESVKNVLLLLAGAFVYSVGTQYFIVPAQIAPGGAVGIALMINHLTSLPIGTLTLLINLPLLVLAWFYLSHRFTVRTAAATVLVSVVLDFLVTPICPMYGGDRLLSSVYGGIVVGIGMALIFQAGFTTGGTDIVAMILAKYTGLEVGRALLVSDIAIVVWAGGLYGMATGLYCLLGTFAKAFVVDSMIESFNQRKVITVITSRPDDLKAFILEKLSRSATVYTAKGAYTGKEEQVYTTVLTRRQAVALRNHLRRADPTAFLTIVNSSEIVGKGFRSL